MNRQDRLRGSEMVPFPSPSSTVSPKNLSPPSPYPYMGVGMVVMLKQGVCVSDQDDLSGHPSTKLLRWRRLEPIPDRGPGQGGVVP